MFVVDGKKAFFTCFFEVKQHVIFVIFSCTGRNKLRVLYHACQSENPGNQKQYYIFTVIEIK